LNTPEVVTPISTPGEYKTPEIEKPQFDWTVSEELRGEGVKKSGSIRMGLGGMLRRGAIKVEHKCAGKAI
jgi:hypothetical protein